MFKLILITTALFIVLKLISSLIETWIVEHNCLKFLCNNDQIFWANKEAQGVKPWASQLKRYHRRNPVFCSRYHRFFHPRLPRPP